MPDPQGQSIRVDVPGVGVVEFPAGTSPEQMEAALSKYKAPTMGQTAADIGVGALKSTGRKVLDLATLAAKVNPVRLMTAPFEGMLPEQMRMGYVPPQVNEMLKETNRAQNVGGRTADVLSAVIPAGMALRGARAASVAKSALPMSPLSAPAKGLSAAEFLATLENGATPAATAATTSAMPSTISSLLKNGAKFGAGYAVVNELKRMLTGGQ